MRFERNQNTLYLKTIFNSLEINRKLFCNYIKQYANKKNVSLNDDSYSPLESEDQLLKILEEILTESIDYLKKIERIANDIKFQNVEGECLSYKDQYFNWKNDLALRMIVVKNLRRLNSVDLQRALFICLDSPYIKN